MVDRDGDLVDGNGGFVDGYGGLVDGNSSLVDGDGGLVDRDGCLVFCRDCGSGLMLNDNDDESRLVSSSEDDGDGRFVLVSCILLQVLPLWHHVEHGFPARWQEHCLLRQPSCSYMVCHNRHCQDWLFLLLHVG